MKVVFAPDWRSGVPYQSLLADALSELGVEVEFLTGYKRGLPLCRLVNERAFDLLHLHWPEAYYPRRHDGFDWFRQARFTTDLSLATRHHPLVFTAHNLRPHNRGGECYSARNVRAPFRHARAVIAHSAAARECILATHHLPADRVHVIPHGDLSPSVGPPVARSEAAGQLGLGPGPLCLMFGTVEPYKGIEEVLAHWRAARPGATLAIVGKPRDAAYRAEIERLAAGIERVELRLAWLTDGELGVWLSAADAVLLNYRDIFTSGAAALARSWGVPIVLPRRLRTVDLAEPSPFVHRFDSFDTDFATTLTAALGTPSDFNAAADWREATAWPRLARATLEIYHRALGSERDSTIPQSCAESPAS